MNAGLFTTVDRAMHRSVSSLVQPCPQLEDAGRRLAWQEPCGLASTSMRMRVDDIPSVFSGDKIAHGVAAMALAPQRAQAGCETTLESATNHPPA